MQLQGLIIMLFLLVAIPAAIIFSSDNTFFIIMSLILLFASVKSIVLPSAAKHKEADDEELSEEDVEGLLNIDLKRFGLGTKVVKNLVIILFFVYCNFFLDIIWFRIVISAIILYWIYDLMKNVSKSKHHSKKVRLADRILFSAINVATIGIIAATAYNKFLKM